MSAKLLILTCLAALITSAKGVEAAKAKKIRVDPSIGHFGYLPFNKWLFGDSAHAYYTSCDNYQLSQYAVERTCEVVLVGIDNEGVSTNRTCPVKFRPNERAAEKFWPSVRGDRVILPHVYFARRNERNFPSEMYLKYRVVSMHSCESHDVKLLVNPDFVVRNNLLYFHNNIVPHESGGIGVFVPNDGLCYGATCKLNFDASGRRIGRPAPYLPEEMTGNFVQVFPTSAPDGYFALVLEWKERRADGKRPYGDAMRVVYASEGKSAELMKFSYRAGLTELFADSSNGLFAVCRKYDARNGARAIRCAQFDENSRRRTMDTAFNLGNATRPIAVYNAPGGGGLLLISGKCGHKSDENLCQNLIFEQFRLNGKGKVRHIHECQYNVPLAAFAQDGENGQLCVSLYNSCDNNRFEVFLTKKCYAKKLFF